MILSVLKPLLLKPLYREAEIVPRAIKSTNNKLIALARIIGSLLTNNPADKKTNDSTRNASRMLHV
jgi:hypothetical protein